jgi:hypothetical protein
VGVTIEPDRHFWHVSTKGRSRIGRVHDAIRQHGGEWKADQHEYLVPECNGHALTAHIDYLEAGGHRPHRHLPADLRGKVLKTYLDADGLMPPDKDAGTLAVQVYGDGDNDLRWVPLLLVHSGNVLKGMDLVAWLEERGYRARFLIPH